VVVLLRILMVVGSSLIEATFLWCSRGPIRLPLRFYSGFVSSLVTICLQSLEGVGFRLYDAR
jgi:hypothetical protein